MRIYTLTLNFDSTVHPVFQHTTDFRTKDASKTTFNAKTCV